MKYTRDGNENERQKTCINLSDTELFKNIRMNCQKLMWVIFHMYGDY